MFFTDFFVYFVITKTQNRGSNNLPEHHKVTKLKSNFYLILG